jgi:hypothetical protein
MMKGFKIIFAVAALTLSGAAFAGPAWTYVDLGAFIGDSADKDAETQGAALRGSFGFANIWHVQADFASGDLRGGKSETPNGADLTAYSIRGGIHPALSDNTDFVLDLGYGNLEEKEASAKNSADILALRTGVRSNVGPVELRAFVSLEAFDGSDDSDAEGRNISYSVGGQYNFSDAWAVGTDVTVSEQDDLMNIYVRWSFGN